MPSSNRRIGLVGVGFGVQVYVPAFRSEGWEVAAICSRSRDKAAKAAETAGVRDIHTDPMNVSGNAVIAVNLPEGSERWVHDIAVLERVLLP